MLTVGLAAEAVVVEMVLHPVVRAAQVIHQTQAHHKVVTAGMAIVRLEAAAGVRVRQVELPVLVRLVLAVQALQAV